ncbi:NADP-dependent oxidoreductase [Dermatophilaceae bacterium Soc4.6]
MTTRSVAPQGFGGPEQLSLTTSPTAEPQAGEVRLAVRAIGVNPIDWKLYSGAFGTHPGMLAAIGSDLAGTVEALGADVTGWSLGDAVVVASLPGSAYADHVIAPVELLVAKPESVSFEVAAGVGVVAGTAVHALETVHLGDGETLLLHGGAGGVGGLVVQLATRRGARVIATASAGNHDYLRGLGAEPVLYGEGLEQRVRDLAPEGVDAAIDAVGTDEALDTSVALVADRSRVVTIAGFARVAELGIVAIGGGPGADPGTEVRAAAVPEVLALLASGEVELPVARTYPLEQTEQAHRDSMDGHTRGKLVVVP